MMDASGTWGSAMLSSRPRECFRCGADIPAGSRDVCPDCGATASDARSRLRPLGVFLYALGVLHLIACAAIAVLAVLGVLEADQPVIGLVFTAVGFMGALLFLIFALTAFLLATEVRRTC